MSSCAYEFPAFVDLRRARTILAWTSVLAALCGIALWALVPVALHVSSERTGTGALHKTQARVLGFANAYGAPFAVLWALVLAPVWLAAQPSAQISLALVTVALFAHLKLVDAARDARAIQASFTTDPARALTRLQQGASTAEVAREQGAVAVSLDEVVPLALLARLASFASGHQATLSSIQWKSAFVLTPTVSYPFSHLLAILNTFGPGTLVALAALLLGIWNVEGQRPDQRNGQGARGASRRSRRYVPLLARRSTLVGYCLGARAVRRCCGGTLLSGRCLRRGICSVRLSWFAWTLRCWLGCGLVLAGL